VEFGRYGGGDECSLLEGMEGVKGVGGGGDEEGVCWEEGCEGGRGWVVDGEDAVVGW